MSFLAQWNPPGYVPTAGETAYNTALMVLWQLLYWPSIVLYVKRSALFPLRGRAFWAAYIYVALIYIEGGQAAACSACFPTRVRMCLRAGFLLVLVTTFGSVLPCVVYQYCKRARPLLARVAVNSDQLGVVCVPGDTLQSVTNTFSIFARLWVHHCRFKITVAIRNRQTDSSWCVKLLLELHSEMAPRCAGTCRIVRGCCQSA